VLGGLSTNYYVIVAVDKQTALHLAAALGLDSAGSTGAQIEIVRSTGEPGTTQKDYEMAPLVPLRRRRDARVTLSVGVGATKAPWSGTLRSHVRDHGQGLSVRVIMDRGELERAATGSTCW